MSGDIAGRGETLARAFAEIGVALFSTAVPSDRVEPREIREVRAHGQRIEGLLLAWIGECRYVHEIEGFVCHHIEMAVFDAAPSGGAEPLRLHATIHGEELDRDRHGDPGAMPAVSPSGVSIESLGPGFEVRVCTEP